MAIFNGWRITRTGIIFVVGLVILAGLVFAGVYWVSQRGEQARREEAIKVAEQNLEQQSEPIAQEETTEETTESETNNQPVAVEEGAGQGAQEQSLPETGGVELMALMGVTALALAAGYYVQSRRLARGL